MDNLSGIRKATGMLCLWVAGLVVISCESNFQDPPVSPEELIGKYKGMISFDKFVSFEGDTETILKEEIGLDIGNDYVTIHDFPVLSILLAVENEETALEIAKQVGTIDYQMKYYPEVNENKEWIRLILSPGPLKFSYTTAQGIRKEISTFMNPGIKVSLYESRQLQLKVIVEEIRINDKPLFIMDEQYITLNARKGNS